MDSLIAKQMAEKAFVEKVERFGRRKPQSKFEVLEKMNESVTRIAMRDDGRKFILKRSSLNQGIAGIASSRMYNQIGLNTPEMQPLSRKGRDFIITVQKDVSDLEGLETVLARDDLDYQMIEHNFFTHDKWQIFYDTNLRNAFLKFMTPGCLEELENRFLVGEIQTEYDTWLRNMILCKTKGAKKYEHLISIDLEELMIMQLGQYGETFKDFIYRPYYSATPQQTLDRGTSYRNRLWEILELAQDGVLSRGNIDAIKKALGHDFPKELEEICSQQIIYGRTRKNIVEPVKYLWDYARDTFEKGL